MKSVTSRVTRNLLHLLPLVFLLAIQVRAQMEKEIVAVLDSQVAAWNRADVPAYMKGYWKSDSLLFTSGGNIQRGWESTLEKYEKAYPTKDQMGRLSFSELEIHPLSPDAAWILGHWKLQRSKDQPGGVFTLIVRKFPDGWKVVHDHTSIGAKGKNQK